MSSPKKQYYENLADSLIEKFNQRGIEGYYCDNKEEALKNALNFTAKSLRQTTTL